MSNKISVEYQAGGGGGGGGAGGAGDGCRVVIEHFM